MLNTVFYYIGSLREVVPLSKDSILSKLFNSLLKIISSLNEKTLLPLGDNSLL